MKPCQECLKLEKAARREGKCGYVLCATCLSQNESDAQADFVRSLGLFGVAPSSVNATPPDWYDGKPKTCPGTGKLSLLAYHGVCSPSGARQYESRCAWCDKEFEPRVPMPAHTFVPVRLEDFVFKQGKFIYGIEIELNFRQEYIGQWAPERKEKP